MNAHLTFLGAAGTVTGSKTLLEARGARVLVDCGLFQGWKTQRLKNWDRLPFDPSTLDAVVLTHAHLDHSGYLPLLARSGFRGPVYCTAGTQALCGLLLPDSGHLHEEDARYANRKGFSKHRPALPLYTQADAVASLRRLHPVALDAPRTIAPGVVATLTRAGHLLGAASVTLEVDGMRVLFSGDVGRPDDAVMRAPAPPPRADYFVVESTYGDRAHPKIDTEAELGPLLARAAARGGVVVIPAFAIGRAQALLLHIARLKARGEIPRALPVFLNSPMAIDATKIYREFRAEHRLSARDCDAMCRAATLVNSVDESIALNAHRGPMVIISASGMATGGRVVHHLKAFAPDPRNLIVLAGYQAGGTRGAALAAGAATIRIHGEDVPVRAEVAQLSSASSHADADELLAWLRAAGHAPRRVYVNHGEPAAADALRGRIERELRWDAVVPEYRDRVALA
jgi:metallo-beta-lactamase family protein